MSQSIFHTGQLQRYKEYNLYDIIRVNPHCDKWQVYKMKYNNNLRQNANNNVNNLLEQCTDSSNGNQSHPLYNFTNITKLLQYNIDSLHDPKYLVAPKVLLFFFNSAA